MKHIEQTYVIEAPLDRVWEAFIDPEVMADWTGGSVKMDDSEGGRFSLWSGDVHGTNTKVVPQRLLEQDWFSGDEWSAPSKVSFAFEQQGDRTIVELVQDNVPNDEAKSIEEGWEYYYFDPIKELLEG